MIYFIQPCCDLGISLRLGLRLVFPGRVLHRDPLLPLSGGAVTAGQGHRGRHHQEQDHHPSQGQGETARWPLVTTRPAGVRQEEGQEGLLRPGPATRRPRPGSHKASG